MCGYSHFTGQAIQVKFKGSLSGLELIRLHYDYAHFTGQAIQVRLKGCDYAHTTGKAIQVRLEGQGWLGPTMPTLRGRPDR